MRREAAARVVRWAVPDPGLLRRLVCLALAAGVVVGCWWLLRLWTGGQTALFMISLFWLAVLLWSVLADRAWWAIVPVGVSFGGFFFFGFKIYVYEAAVLLSLAPLVLQRVLTDAPPERRPSLPLSVYLLVAYLHVHLLASLCNSQWDGLRGAGNIVRVYAVAIWPLIFLLAFHHFGSTSVLRGCFVVMYAAAFIRFILGVVVHRLPEGLIIRGINLVLAAIPSGSGDLRVSALLFAMMNLCMMGMATSRFRLGFWVLLVLASTALSLMGSGRGAFLMVMALLLFFALVRKRPVLMGSWLALLVLLASVVNLYPELLYRLPPPVRRTLSVLVVNRPTVDVHRDVRISDDWHFELMRLGRKNWLRSPLSFLVGNRVYPLNDVYYSPLANDRLRAEIAASIAAYESGLWTVLATLGVAGAALYALVFRTLLRGLWTEVREHGLRDYRHSFYFMALATSVLWLLFCWIAGHFPSQELMFAAIAHAAYQEENRRSASGPVWGAG